MKLTPSSIDLAAAVMNAAQSSQGTSRSLICLSKVTNTKGIAMTKPGIDTHRIEEINPEMASYIKAMQHVDEATFAVVGSHVDELLRERCRTMGLPEDEIARIEQESEMAVDQQI